MKKVLSLVLAMVMCLSVFTACSSNEETDIDVPVSTATFAIAGMKGPTTMGMTKLMKDAEVNNADEAYEGNVYNVEMYGTAQEINPLLIQGQLDVAAVPANVAATLYAKTEGAVQVAAVNTLGVLYIITKDNAVSTVADLEGKTILASGQGTIAEYALNYVLESNGFIIGENVTIEFATEHAESVTKALAGGYDAVLLPEPFVTQLLAKDSSFSVAVNITEEWEKTGNSTLAMGCIAVNAAFYENNKDAVKKFVEDYAVSADYINNNIDAASLLIEAHGIMPSAIAAKAIPNANIVCLSGEKMKSALTGTYNVLLSMNPAIIGGQMPADDFFIDVTV